MEIPGPLTVEEMQEASILAAPRLLRGTMQRRARNLLHPSKWKLGIFLVIAAVFLGRLLSDPQYSGHGKWIPPVLLLSGVAYQFFWGPKVARLGYERRIACAPRVVAVDLDGVHLEDKTGIPQLRPWPVYQKWREGSLIFLLRGPHRVSNIIPKRGMTPEQVDALRVLLALHMPDSA
ncbi:MAG TPA: YcxB family protein [Acidobacteriaceae bacterium]|nr:YcxB family protein [Acidobacteriaceae bacterium]